MTDGPEHNHDKGLQRQPRVARIFFQMDDGTIKYIEGDDAREFNNQMSDLIFLDLIHGGSQFPALPWINILAKDLPEVVAKPVTFSEQVDNDF